MILKCQHSLVTSHEVPQMLLYDRARKWQWSGDVTPEWAPLFAELGFRFFANCKVFKDGRPPEFVRRVPDQDWSGGVSVTDNKRDGSSLATVPYESSANGDSK
jgi:hypothetical protein